jgi:multimeric flavodoxin WrbA
MKMLGLTCGSRMGNSEILIKEALMGAEEAGADVQLLRMSDLDIKPCIACGLGKCPASTKGPEGCVQKDDGPFLYNVVMECDALIISAPVYTKTPPGYLRAIGDRVLGPKGDVAFKIEQKKLKSAGDERAMQAWIDERAFKDRVGGFISVGGAPLSDWVSLGLPLLHTMTFSLQIAIVDQMQVLKAALPGSVLFNDAAVRRARKLGRNVAEQMGRSFNAVKYRGDKRGTCPVCHLDVMIMGEDATVECAICGIHGKITMDGNKVKVDFPQEEQKKSVLELEGKRIHFYEIGDVAKEHMPRMGEIPPKLEKYKAYKPFIKPPRKKSGKSPAL